LRTTGDERVWRSSSGVMSARGFSSAGGDGGGGGAGAGAGADVCGGRELGGGAGAGALGGGAEGDVGADVAPPGADVPDDGGGLDGGGVNAAVEAGVDGAGVAAADGAALATSPSPMMATTVLMGTVAPGSTRISLSTPEAGAGISASTLSVEISKRGSSRWTRSPTFFIHLVIVPSAIDSPIWGMMTSVISNHPRLRPRASLDDYASIAWP
jgi:hypothetical protein